jgi:hypothetical protein
MQTDGQDGPPVRRRTSRRRAPNINRQEVLTLGEATLLRAQLANGKRKSVNGDLADYCVDEAGSAEVHTSILADGEDTAEVPTSMPTDLHDSLGPHGTPTNAEFTIQEFQSRYDVAAMSASSLFRTLFGGDAEALEPPEGQVPTSGGWEGELTAAF